ncbi:MAG TPA: hypothetical protein VGY53_08565, partial [Isosphaeraceae bacterium]|nr:hypothetical protein [Isosphaeraceae bacterium]
PEPAQQTLHVSGSFDRWAAGPAQNLSLDIAGNDWPLALAQGGVAASGRFSGEVQVRRESARWRMEGRTWIAALDLAGDLLAGDHLLLDRVGGTWALAQQASGWSLSKLDLSAPVGWLRLDGSFPVANGASTKLEGELDLAALANQIPRALRLREDIAIEQGKAKLSIEGRGTSLGQSWQVEANVSDLAARREGQLVQIREPVLLSARLGLEEHSFRVERMGLKTAFIDVSAEGSLERGVSLKGTVDLDGLERSLRQWIDTGNLALAGKGELDGTYRRAGDGFDLRLHTRFDHFGLAGLSRDPLSIEKIELDAQLGGPADVSGLPRSLSNVRVALGGGGIAAEITAREKQGGVELVGQAQVPFVLADRSGKADARLEGLWSKGKLEINTLRAGLQPTDDSKRLHFAWSARGRFDLATGTLVLSPAANTTAPAAIALAPDGLRLAGLGRSDTPLQVDGGFEGSVGAIAQAYAEWTGRPQPELGGRWSLRTSARGGDDGLNLSGRLDLHGLSWPGPDGTSRHEEPELGAVARAVYRTKADRLDLVEFVFTSPYATLEASGQVADLGGSRRVELKGALQPEWKRLNASIAQWIEPGARLKGTPRPFWLKAPLTSASTSEILAGLEAEAGFDLQEAEFFGMHVGPAPIVVRAKGGRLRFDPIRTTLNGGRLSADPELLLDEDGSLVLTLAPGAAIEGAEVNPEVTRRVLSFVAPVLEQATRARGRVSAKIDRAEVPLVSRAGRTTQVEGKVVFTDLEFTPGPIADQLFDLLGQDRVPTLRLNQPVTLAIVDGRVIQRGLAIPVGRLTQIELEGSVDFQRNLDL